VVLRRRPAGRVDDDEGAGAGDLLGWFALARCRLPVDVDPDPDPDAVGLGCFSLGWPELEGCWVGRDVDGGSWPRLPGADETAGSLPFLTERGGEGASFGSSSTSIMKARLAMAAIPRIGT